MLSNLREKSLKDVTGIMGNAQLGSIAPNPTSAELLRRQIEEQIRRNKLTKWTLIVIAVTSSLTAIFQFLSWFVPRIPQ